MPDLDFGEEEESANLSQQGMVTTEVIIIMAALFV